MALQVDFDVKCAALVRARSTHDPARHKLMQIGARARASWKSALSAPMFSRDARRLNVLISPLHRRRRSQSKRAESRTCLKRSPNRAQDRSEDPLPRRVINTGVLKVVCVYRFSARRTE